MRSSGRAAGRSGACGRGRQRAAARRGGGRRGGRGRGGGGERRGDQERRGVGGHDTAAWREREDAGRTRRQKGRIAAHRGDVAVEIVAREAAGLHAKLKVLGELRGARGTAKGGVRQWVPRHGLRARPRQGGGGGMAAGGASGAGGGRRASTGWTGAARGADRRSRAHAYLVYVLDDLLALALCQEGIPAGLAIQVARIRGALAGGRAERPHHLPRPRRRAALRRALPLVLHPPRGAQQAAGCRGPRPTPRPRLDAIGMCSSPHGATPKFFH